MTFAVGERVRWKDDAAYLQLSFPGTDIGTVMSVYKSPDQDGRTQLDIKLDNGEVMRRISDHRFERITSLKDDFVDVGA